jgi:hypothetical protein
MVRGREHRSTLTTTSNVAVTLDRQGKYKAVGVIIRQTRSLSKAVFEREYSSTLMSNLATVPGIYGEYEAWKSAESVSLLLEN